MIVLVLVAVVLVGSLTLGWRMLADATSPRAANGVLLMIAGVGVAAWLVSEASFDAGL